MQLLDTTLYRRRAIECSNPWRFLSVSNVTLLSTAPDINGRVAMCLISSNDRSSAERQRMTSASQGMKGPGASMPLGLQAEMMALHH